MMYIPTWDETKDKFDSGETLNPLEFFIREYEPISDQGAFRDDLRRLIEWVKKD